ALLAELLADGGRTPEMLAVKTDLVKLDPQSAKLAKEVVLGSARAGLPAQVVDIAPIAIFIDPGDPDIHAAYGRALAARGRTREGAAALEHALAFAPGEAAAAEIHRTLGDLYTRLGDTKNATFHRQAAGAGVTTKPGSGRPPGPAPVT